MKLAHHDLHHEFPEYGERITRLKMSDANFSKLFEEYDKLDHEVRRIEQDGLKISDVELEGMKYRRILLKDQLYAYLKKAV